MQEHSERLVAALGTAAAGLVVAALAAGFYAAFVSSRVAFWTWLAALIVLLPLDVLIRRKTGLLSMQRMSAFYRESGVSHPATRARIAVTFAQFPIPVLLAVFLLSLR